MIGACTRNLGDCRVVAQCLADEGRAVALRSVLLGCATAVVGRKP